MEELFNVDELQDVKWSDFRSGEDIVDEESSRLFGGIAFELESNESEVEELD